MSGLSALERVKHRHKTAFEYITSALEIDEDPDGVKRDAVDYYIKGVEELEKGLGEECIGASREDKEKVERLKMKMKKNFCMAKERLEALLDTENGSKPGTPKAAKKRPDKRRDEARRTSESQKENSRPKSGEYNGRSPGPSRPKTVASKVPTKTKPWNYGGPQRPTRPKNSTRKEESSVRDKINLKNIPKEMANKILDDLVEPGSHSVSLDDVAGQEVAKQVLKEIVILPALRPELFTGLRTPAKGVLLFGPPGTGKTLLAKAVAAEANSNFFSISASTLTSKWVGEGEKMVRALFGVAREVQPSIIFIDEIDSLLCERREGESDSTRRLKTEFMMRFDGVESDKQDRILVMGATNRPQELDDAVLRRFPKRVYVSLPDDKARADLLTMLLAKQSSALSKREISRLSQQTELYSGSDLTELAKDAALGPVREMSHDQLVSIDVKQMRPLQYKDFEQSLRKIKPSASTRLLKVYEEWNTEFGDSSSL